MYLYHVLFTLINIYGVDCQKKRPSDGNLTACIMRDVNLTTLKTFSLRINMVSPTVPPINKYKKCNINTLQVSKLDLKLQPA
jgi:hypothetical protein